MVVDLSKPWVALRVVPRHEKKVDAILGHRGYTHFLPTCRVRRRWADRAKIIEQPLFPGYVFCRSDRYIMEVVRGTPGIICIVSFGGRPHPVADEEIDALQRVVQTQRDVRSFPYLNVGQKMRVIAGPLMGITGIITQFKKHERLVISLDVVMKSISVEIDRSEVALVH